MAPTLLMGDNFLVSKPACDSSYFSLPFSPGPFGAAMSSCFVSTAIPQPVASSRPSVARRRIQTNDGVPTTNDIPAQR
jgi:hypothetical protein